MPLLPGGFAARSCYGSFHEARVNVSVRFYMFLRGPQILSCCSTSTLLRNEQWCASWIPRGGFFPSIAIIKRLLLEEAWMVQLVALRGC